MSDNGMDARTIAQQVAESSPISEDDFRAVVALLGRAAGMEEPLPVRKRAIMEGISDLVDAPRWLWVTSTDVGVGRILTPVAVMSGGFSERQLAMIVEASQDPEHPVPENGPMIDDIVANRHITRTRSDWIDDDDLYAHPQWQLYRKPMGSDHYLFSIYRVGENYISGIGLHRPPGAPDFTPRERRLAHIVMSEIDWLHTADIPKDEVGVEVSRLTPRLRVVFSLLVRGWNRKQIASHLGLTPNTVAGYIKSIYRSFEVSSQPELISRFVSGDGGDAKP